jgi:hypothetical protein
MSQSQEVWSQTSYRCSSRNKKYKYSNYLCNDETNRWVKINTKTGSHMRKRITGNPRKCRSVNDKSGQSGYICNPATGRWVRENGRVGQMIKKNYTEEQYLKSIQHQQEVEPIKKKPQKPQKKSSLFKLSSSLPKIPL